MDPFDEDSDHDGVPDGQENGWADNDGDGVPDDIDAFHGLCLDDHVRRFLLDGQEVPRQWATAAIETSERLFDSHGVGLWLLVRDRVPIGFCGFRAFDELGPEPQLLYALRRPYAGRGLATEAAAIMLEQTRRLGWTRVVGAVDQPNIASQRVLQNLGFGSAGRVPGAFGDTLLFERFEGLTPRRIDAAPGSRFRMGIASTWDGRDARPAETVEVELSLDDCELALGQRRRYPLVRRPIGWIGIEGAPDQVHRRKVRWVHIQGGAGNVVQSGASVA